MSNRSKDETLRLRVEVSQLYLKGETQRQIGRKFGRTQQWVCVQLKAIRQEWRTSAIAKIDEKINLELARLDEIEREAWNGWKRSIGTYKTKTKETGVGPQGAVDRETVKSERLAGDPRFLAIVHDCVKKRTDILGLEAAKGLRLMGPDGGPIKTDNGVSINYDDFARSFMEHTRKRIQQESLGNTASHGAGEPVHTVDANTQAGLVPESSGP